MDRELAEVEKVRETIEEIVCSNCPTLETCLHREDGMPTFCPDYPSTIDQICALFTAREKAAAGEIFKEIDKHPAEGTHYAAAAPGNRTVFKERLWYKALKDKHKGER